MFVSYRFLGAISIALTLAACGGGEQSSTVAAAATPPATSPKATLNKLGKLSYAG